MANPKDNKKRNNRWSRPRKEKKEFSEELLDLARVTRVVKGWRRLRFRATVAIGNKKGKVAIWTGKSIEVAEAVQKAVADAKRKLITIDLTDAKSISHEVKIKYKGAKLLIMPANEGIWVKAWWVMRKILDLAGIQNIIAKRFGSTTALVNAQATIKALNMLEPIRKSKKVEVKAEIIEEKPVDIKTEAVEVKK